MTPVTLNPARRGSRDVEARMNAVLDGKDVAIVDRRTLNTLLAYSAIAKASSDLAADVAQTCADGCMDDLERQRLRVTSLLMRTQLNQLDEVIG